jgi:hypothetical protein
MPEQAVNPAIQQHQAYENVSQVASNHHLPTNPVNNT